MEAEVSLAHLPGAWLPLPVSRGAGPDQALLGLRRPRGTWGALARPHDGLLRVGAGGVSPPADMVFEDSACQWPFLPCGGRPLLLGPRVQRSSSCLSVV